MGSSIMSQRKQEAKPFLKWAGGKKQLLSELDIRLPFELKAGKIKRYVEPFVGAGALLFHIHNNYFVDEYVICDVNNELYVCYQAIKENPGLVIDELEKLKYEYYSLDLDTRSEFYYKLRNKFNSHIELFDYNNYNTEWALRTAQTIVLNRTCFNGLFRVNSKGQFNVPFGKYKNPYIYDSDNVKAVNSVLQKTTILKGDFESTREYINEECFVYLDPPYRPISLSSSFTSYSSDSFNDDDQKRLAQFYAEMNIARKAKLMLSNSDPKNVNPDDHFFERLFPDFKINRVMANRMINCNGSKRGVISELIVMNY
jgi:DNA adenine methylase